MHQSRRAPIRLARREREGEGGERGGRLHTNTSSDQKKNGGMTLISEQRK